MASKDSKPPLSRRRRIFRWCRIALLLLLLLLVVSVSWLSTRGLPKFVIERLVDDLKDRGLAVEAGRIYWDWGQGVVAEDISVVADLDQETEAMLTSKRASIRLQAGHWGEWHRSIQEIQFLNGDLTWRLSDPELQEELAIHQIDAMLAQGENDTWELVQLNAEFKDVQLKAQGRLEHVRQLQFALDEPDTDRQPILPVSETLNRLANYLTNFSFAARPTLNVFFQADAADWESLDADVRLDLPRARTTWGDVRNFQLLAKVAPQSNVDGDATGRLTIRGDSADTPWGRLRNWKVNTLTVPLTALPLQSTNDLNLSFEQIDTPWGNLRNGESAIRLHMEPANGQTQMVVSVDLSAEKVQLPWGESEAFELQAPEVVLGADWKPLEGRFHMQLDQVQQSTNRAGSISLEARLHRRPESSEFMGDDTWAFWRDLEPYPMDLRLTATNTDVAGVEVDSLDLQGTWQPPHLNVTNLYLNLYGGEATLLPSINVDTREIELALESEFDLHRLDHLFSDRFYSWFSPYQWKEAPHVEATGKFLWPDWNNLNPDWREEVVPTLGLSGQFDVGECSYRGIEGLTATSHFYFTNFNWWLPDMTITRPEGIATAEYRGNDRTRKYQWEVVSNIDPQALRPLVKPDQQQAFDYFTNAIPPVVKGTIWGEWRSPELTGFDATVAATNLFVRGEPLDRLQARAAYTNGFLNVRDVTLVQSNRTATAEVMDVDFNRQLMFFTNVVCALSPYSVGRAIGPQTSEAIKPYQFQSPPDTTVEGVLGLRMNQGTDLRFTIDGGPFQWWRFNLDRIAGALHWKDDRLSLTNVTAELYGGEAAGSAEFQFATNRPTLFSFHTVATNANLQPLIRDLFVKTNSLEGLLSVDLTVTEAESRQLETWQGYGSLVLEDGLIWDIPIFGMFSPLFNALSPELGQSRAHNATATYTIVNGTVISTDLVVRSTEFNMQYAGTVDFAGQVDARVEARILREAGFLGQIVSAALTPFTKMFEYRLTGSLSDPQAEPVYIPKFLMIALEPFRMLQNLFKSDEEEEILSPDILLEETGEPPQ